MVKLENGMFGMTNDGDYFVVVNDYLVYESGTYSYVSNYRNDTLSCMYQIMYLFRGCRCFNDVQRAIENSDYRSDTIECVYARYGERTKVEMTIAEIEEKLGIKNLKIVE